jgi:hypothetical protein
VSDSLAAQAPLVGKAIADHARWLDWTRWASALPAARDASAEMEELERIRNAFAHALAAWSGVSPRSVIEPERTWRQLFPGVWIDLDEPGTAGRSDAGAVIFVSPLGSTHRRPLVQTGALTDEDRLAFWLLYRKAAAGDQSLRPIVARWQQIHGAALGVAARRGPS